MVGNPEAREDLEKRLAHPITDHLASLHKQLLEISLSAHIQIQHQDACVSSGEIFQKLLKARGKGNSQLPDRLDDMTSSAAGYLLLEPRLLQPFTDLGQKAYALTYNLAIDTLRGSLKEKRKDHSATQYLRTLQPPYGWNAANQELFAQFPELGNGIVGVLSRVYFAALEYVSVHLKRHDATVGESLQALRIANSDNLIYGSGGKPRYMNEALDALRETLRRSLP